ncbi:acetate--CoA ligase family protein [Pseudorhodoferax sp. Leaf274]|uniref:acetate--CoA ligase family protein n=1 Tax=Pseudorhodoferax sp. Leaf274 TaxID=1736318 RepID=UPI0007035188|nr:hypothetical protein ASF44_00595 [Pseudorhodoferax sp. Leaf274]
MAKIASRDILHKSDIGGVQVNLADGAHVETAWDDIMAAATWHKPGARIEGLLVEKMAPRGAPS